MTQMVVEYGDRQLQAEIPCPRRNLLPSRIPSLDGATPCSKQLRGAAVDETAAAAEEEEEEEEEEDNMWRTWLAGGDRLEEL